MIIENYGQWMDLEPPKNKRNFKLICLCPKCGKQHTRSYLDLQHSSEFMYCTSHKTARNLEKKYGKGVTSSQLVPGAAEKSNATKEKHFGKDWRSDWKNFITGYLQDNFNVDNPANIPGARIKALNTINIKYGSLDNYYRLRHLTEIETAEKNYGSYEEYSKYRVHKQIESLRNSTDDPLLTSIKNIPELKEKRFENYLNELQYMENVRVIFKKDNYYLRCDKCKSESLISYENRIYRCPICYKRYKPKGIIMAISAYLTKLGFEVSNSAPGYIIGKTVDILIKSKNIGINLISTSFDSNLPQCEMYNDTQQCDYNNLTLIHILEDDWHNKPDVIKAKLSDILGKNKTTIDALNCEISIINSEDFNNFCENNHLWGKGNVAKKIGFFYNNELIAVIGLSRPRYLKEYNWEITRVCPKKYISVDNIFNAFINYVIRSNMGSIVYYHDNRWPSSEMSDSMYELRTTLPSIYYWKDDEPLRPWSYFRKGRSGHIAYDEDIPLRLFLLKEGYNILYDCGYTIYVYE